MDEWDIEHWLALYENHLIGLHRDTAAAHVQAAGLTAVSTHYASERVSSDPLVVTLLLGPGDVVRRIERPRRP